VSGAVVRRRAVVRGRVQGVSFRASTQAEARLRGVVGWVRNLPDGSVELEAQGDAAAVDALLAWCGRGPRAARVDELLVEERPPVEGERDLAIRR
jgi:acylphosphatase